MVTRRRTVTQMAIHLSEVLTSASVTALTTPGEMKEISEDKVPITLDEAVQMLYDALEPADIAEIKKHHPGDVHFDLGMFLRNTWSLWEDTPLTRNVKERFKIFGHGDDISSIILHMLWEKVIGTPPWLGDHAVEELVEGFKKHWRRQGIDPVTGKEL